MIIILNTLHSCLAKLKSLFDFVLILNKIYKRNLYKILERTFIYKFVEKFRKNFMQVKLKELINELPNLRCAGIVLMFLSFTFQIIILYIYFDITNIQSIFKNPIVLIDIITDSIMFVAITIVALIFSLNIRKMRRDNILINRINKIGALSSLSILLLNKTGVITKGVLSISEIYLADGLIAYNVNDIPFPIYLDFIRGVILNNSASISKGKIVGGNSIDRVLLKFIQNYYETNKFIEDFEISTIDNRKYIKDNPEVVLKNCIYYLDIHGKPQYLDNNIINNYISEQANKAMFLLALAVDNCLICIISIKDNIRPEIISTIKEFKNDDIQPIIVTNDIKETAMTIAKQIFLLESENGIIINYDELIKKTDEEIKVLIPNLKVVSRTSFLDRIHLIKIMQKLNSTVGIVGNDIYDFSVLKKSYISFTLKDKVNISKKTSDITILNNDFSAIKKSIVYGKYIFKLIQKFFIFQLIISIVIIILNIVGLILKIC